jgi:hypothetical protein
MPGLEARRLRAVVVAVVMAMGLAAGIAEAREFRFSATGGPRLLPEGPHSLGLGDGAAAGLRSARSDCRRWRAAAASLGETYAGHRLRQTVVRRQCRSLDSDLGEEAWDWPWASLHEGRVLPPKLHVAQGDWEIRCGSVGGRRRCALLNRSHGPSGDVNHPGAQAIVTHFVIDRIAGRETLLWRLFVPAVPAAQASLAQHDLAPTLEAAVRARGEVRYRLEDVERAELFPVCAAAGCLMEASVHHAGEVATRLWDGRSIDIRISLATDVPMILTLPAIGFRVGFKELVRLRRDEINPDGN